MSHVNPSEGLSACPLLRYLTPSEIEGLVAASEAVHFPAGHRLFDEGDPYDGFLILTAGAVAVVKRLPDGGEKELARLVSGSSLGEMALLTGEARRTAGATALEDTDALLVPREGFEELLDRGDLAALKVVRAVAGVLAQRLAQMNETVMDLLAQSREAAQVAVPELDQFRERVLDVWAF